MKKALMQKSAASETSRLDRLVYTLYVRELMGGGSHLHVTLLMGCALVAPRRLSENSNFFSNRGMRKKLPQVYG